MCADIELPKACRLPNHGPTVIVGAAHGGRRNVMAAAWAMPLDADPPKVAVVNDKSSFTRDLVETSGEFALSVPCRDVADRTFTIGSTSGATVDTFECFGLAALRGHATAAPLLEGCVAWLGCRLLHEPHVQLAYELCIGQVLAAQADARVFRHGRWHFDGATDALRIIRHIAGGAFFTAGDALQPRRLD